MKLQKSKQITKSKVEKFRKMSLKTTNYKFKLKRTPEQSVPKFPSGNVNLEILKLVKKLSTNQEEFQQYIASEILSINEKLNFILEKFNQIEVEVDENAENESQEEEGVEMEESYLNKMEEYELEDQETETLDQGQEEDDQGEEVQEQEQEEAPQVYYEISQDRDIADINPDNMLTLLYDPKTKKETAEHKVLINMGQDSFVQFEQIDVMSQMVGSSPNKKQKTKQVSEKYFPKIEKKSSEENPYSAASEEELLTFPIKCLDHLEAVENILISDTQTGAQFREELVSLIF